MHLVLNPYFHLSLPRVRYFLFAYSVLSFCNLSSFELFSKYCIFEFTLFNKKLGMLWLQVCSCNLATMQKPQNNCNWNLISQINIRFLIKFKINSVLAIQLCDSNTWVTVRLLKFINSEFTNLHISCAPNMSQPKHQGTFVTSIYHTGVNQTTGKLCKFVSVWATETEFFTGRIHDDNDCMKDKPFFVKWSHRFVWKKRALKTVDLCFGRKHLCPCVYSDTCEVLK